MSGTAGLVGHLAIGDNLHILREYVDDESIDLVYLDPPFNSNRAYSLIFKDPTRGHSEAQAVAFKDQWTWNAGTEARFRDLLLPSLGSRATTRLSHLLANQVSAFERTQMAAYLVEMAVRLIELHRALKPTGSLYLHCDPTASHYLKVVLDAIFGPKNFRNEIIWKRANAHNDPHRYGRVTDSILYYVKSDGATWNTQHTPYREDYYRSHFKRDDAGRYYRTVPVDAPRHGEGSPGLLYDWHGKIPASTRTWAVKRETMERYERDGLLRYTRTGTPTLLQYADQMPGVPLQNVWTDIPPVNPQARERIGYPTQKPLALLGRIIAASSNPGDIVLDPFCGCGTALEAAQGLGRNWIGIDISVRALDVIRDRFRVVYDEDVPYRVLAPVDEETARRLAETKPHGRREFEAWALTLIGARKNVDRDRGVDGLIPFVGPRGRIQQALVSVKSGHASPSEVRDLVGAVHRERSPAGIFLTLAEPSKEMKLEAARATPLISGVPRIQIITIREALDEARPARPILPAYRQEELFDAIPAAVDDFADLEADLRDAIAQGRAAKAAGQHEWRARIIETMQRVLEEEAEFGAATASPAAPRSPRTSTRDLPVPQPLPGSGDTG